MALETVPSMTSAHALDYLSRLGADWTGQGVAVECGSWLGASAGALLAGLVTAGYDRPFYAFDRWRASTSEVEKAAAQGVTLEKGQDLEPLFRANVETVYPNVVTAQGQLQRAKWGGDPIEFFILDAAKVEPAFSTVLKTFGPSWVAGAVVGLMDFAYYRQFSGAARHRYLCQVRFLKAHKSRFTPLRGYLDCSPAFFRYEGGIDWEGT